MVFVFQVCSLVVYFRGGRTRQDGRTRSVWTDKISVYYVLDSAYTNLQIGTIRDDQEKKVGYENLGLPLRNLSSESTVSTPRWTGFQLGYAAKHDSFHVKFSKTHHSGIIGALCSVSARGFALCARGALCASPIFEASIVRYVT